MNPKELTIKVTYRQYPPDLEALPTEDRDNADPRTYGALTILKVTVNGKDITGTKVVDPVHVRPQEEYWQLLTDAGCDILDLRYFDNS